LANRKLAKSKRRGPVFSQRAAAQAKSRVQEDSPETRVSLLALYPVPHHSIGKGSMTHQIAIQSPR